MAVHGDAGESVITANDPLSMNHTYAITTPPAHGMAKVRADGHVRVCTDPTAAPGSDAVTVTVTDSDHPDRAIPMTIPITIADGSAPASCDVDAFSSGDDGGGCCEAGGGGAGAIPLAFGVLALVIRSRRGRDLAQV
jgi:hypothetical protein